MILSPRLLAALSASAALIACAGHDATPGSAAVPEGKGVDSNRVASSAAAPPPVTPPPGAAPKAAVAGPDTAKPRLLSGRSKHDSLTFASAVAFGRRQAAKWPASPAPLPGAILPSHRIIAFYGNPLSKRVGVLGEYPPDVMLAKLDTVVREWQAADPSTPVKPALHYIAAVAQGSAGRDGMWRARMDSARIETVYG